MRKPTPPVVLVDISDAALAAELTGQLTLFALSVATPLDPRRLQTSIDVVVTDGKRTNPRSSNTSGGRFPLLVVRFDGSPRQRIDLLRGGADQVVTMTAPADEIAEVVLALLRRRDHT